MSDSRNNDFGVGIGAELSDEHKAMLDHEDKFYKDSGAKADAIREKFGINTIRYYQTINSLIDHPAALSYNPQLVNLLNRIRDTRRRARSAQSINTERPK